MSNEQPIKLLLVDDEVDFLKSLSERLSLRDFDVTTATDGKQAIKAAKKGQFDVAILDLRMPGMDGTEVLKTLKDKHKATWKSLTNLTTLSMCSRMRTPQDSRRSSSTTRNVWKTSSFCPWEQAR
jgi:CheY-like chemotaxis protein